MVDYASSRKEVMDIEKIVCAVAFASMLPCLARCGTDTAVATTTVIEQETSLPKETEGETMAQTEPQINELYTAGTKIAKVMSVLGKIDG